MKNNKKSFTLGVCNGETASACLFEKGILVAAASEERFTRKKYDKSFPVRSIEYLLSHSNIKLNEIEHIAYAWAKDFHPDLKTKYDKRSKECKKISEESFKIFSEKIKSETLLYKPNLKKFKDWAETS